jgi:hypothetical protein
MTSRPRGDDERDAIRRVLERATERPDSDAGPLLDRVPAVLASARRHVERPPADDTLAAIVPAGRKMLPRLAAVAALLVALSVGLRATDGTPDAAPESLESWILGESDAAIGDDVVIEVLLGEEDAHG